jgi:hypothetical protein
MANVPVIHTGVKLGVSEMNTVKVFEICFDKKY